MGPLAGYRVVELAAKGPVPFVGMLLSDLGADVVRVDRVAARATDQDEPEALCRGRRSVAVDLKSADGIEVVLGLVGHADAFIEGLRPGVTERMGLGPDACLGRNPRLVYGRMTGWGQDGPYAQMAGHDVNYIALAGTLHTIGRAGEPPVPPLNYLGDYGGGAMLLTVGVLAALLEAKDSGVGQVIDASMLDGAALLTTIVYSLQATGRWNDERGTNPIDTGSPFYNVYETSDGGYVSVSAMTPAFYLELLRGLGLEERLASSQWDASTWPATKEQFASIFRTKTRDAWCVAFDGTDACVAPVLSPREAPGHPHNEARRTFTTFGGIVQPAPAPRFSRTPATIAGPAPRRGEHTRAVLEQWGFDQAAVDKLVDAGVVSQTPA